MTTIITNLLEVLIMLEVTGSIPRSVLISLKTITKNSPKYSKGSLKQLKTEVTDQQ